MLDKLAHSGDLFDLIPIAILSMKFRFRIFAILILFITAFSTSGCWSGSDPYGVNSPGYYGGTSNGMQQNLIRPGPTSRDLYAE